MGETENTQPAFTPKAHWYDGESTLIKGTEAAKASRMREKEWERLGDMTDEWRND